MSNTFLIGPLPIYIWPEGTVATSSSLLIDSDRATCIEFPPDDMHTPFVVKVQTESFTAVKRFVVVQENLRDTMDPCNGLPFLVMTQTGGKNITNAICQPYCGRAVRCHLNKGTVYTDRRQRNRAGAVQVDCHCQDRNGCNGIFLQISLTSLVNQQAPGKLCEIELLT